MNSNRLLVVVVILVVGIGGATGFLMYRRHSGPLPFTITFKDAKQLRPGQFVVYKGVRIGVVKSVELDSAGKIDVAVVIDAEHRAQICQQATFRIEKPSLLDLSGEHQVTMSDNSGTCIAVARSSIVQGSEGVFDDLVTRGKAMIQSAVPALGR
jgi:hypothetical protein